MSLRVLVPLAEGFEEIEAIVPIDVFRRAGFAVFSAGLAGDRVKAARATVHQPDVLLSEVLEDPFDLIYLPGGQPGANHLAAHEALGRRLQRQAEEGRWLAAICAAPLVLEKAGLLRGRAFVCHPGAAKEISSGSPRDAAVVVDGKLITGRAAGAAMELALTVVRELAGAEKVEEVDQGLLCEPGMVDRVLMGKPA